MQPAITSTLINTTTSHKEQTIQPYERALSALMNDRDLSLNKLESHITNIIQATALNSSEVFADSSVAKSSLDVSTVTRFCKINLAANGHDELLPTATLRVRNDISFFCRDSINHSVDKLSNGHLTDRGEFELNLFDEQGRCTFYIRLPFSNSTKSFFSNSHNITVIKCEYPEIGGSIETSFQGTFADWRGGLQNPVFNYSGNIKQTQYSSSGKALVTKEEFVNNVQIALHDEIKLFPSVPNIDTPNFINAGTPTAVTSLRANGNRIIVPLSEEKGILSLIKLSQESSNIVFPVSTKVELEALSSHFYKLSATLYKTAIQHKDSTSTLQSEYASYSSEELLTASNSIRALSFACSKVKNLLMDGSTFTESGQISKLITAIASNIDPKSQFMELSTLDAMHIANSMNQSLNQNTSISPSDAMSASAFFSNLEKNDYLNERTDYFWRARVLRARDAIKQNISPNAILSKHDQAAVCEALYEASKGKGDVQIVIDFINSHDRI